MFIADFHIHSKYSRATSKKCAPETLDLWARRKGLDMIGTGDFTHPAWREELKEKLVPTGDGLYTLKKDFRQDDAVAGRTYHPRFIISGEISSIYKKNGKVRKIHNLILLPGLEQAEAIALRLEAMGCNLHSDGRPILGLDSRDLLEIVLDKCPEAIFIPAHIWTPHFSLYGAYSGFDTIEECFEDLTGCIWALETGLSSSPAMNWQLSALDGFTLVSNSDAHSPAKLAREANIFHTDLSYHSISHALKNRDTDEFYGTIEFFPEEGKYHYDGHRNCKVCWKPAETKAAAGICPVCGGRITVGVLHRVEDLADREEGFVPAEAKTYESLIPLPEIIASATGVTTASKKVKGAYLELINHLGPELFILREAPLEDIEKAAGPCIAEGIRRLRRGQVDIQPGFDGEYGKIKVMDKHEMEVFSGQLSFFKEPFEDRENRTRAKSSDSSKSPSITASHTAEAEAACALDKAGDTAKNYVPDLPYGLNHEQWQAVSAPDQAVAVIAGPGTGKTRTLVCRISYLIEKCGIKPSQITAVTFTNKAAKEMGSRLEQHSKDKGITKTMNIGTFHSLCLKILSRERDKITVIDEYTALGILEEIIKSKKLKLSPRNALREISLLKSGGILPGDSQEINVPDEVYSLYCARLDDYGVLDYDDILLEVLREYEEGREDIEGQGDENPFAYLLVDEFQDINQVQYRLIREWSRKSESVFIIGDPDQSIYGFRGSDPCCFERFKKEFPSTRQIRLTRNYRSTPEILSCAQGIISGKTAGSPVTGLEAQRESGAKVRLLEAGEDFSQAVFVAKEINRLVGGIDMLDTQNLQPPKGKKGAAGHSRGFSDIALLYRTNRQAELLEQCLSIEGIPYLVVGREDFLGEEPIREAVAFFSFLLNQEDLASLRVCLKQENSLPAAMRQKILKGYSAEEKSLSSLGKIIENLLQPTGMPESLRKLMELLEKYESIVGIQKPWELMDSWIRDKGLEENKSMERLLNISVLHEDMTSLINNLILGRESDVVRSGSRVYSPDAVSLMTFHGAKGLEFPIVFLYGVNEGILPLKSSRHEVDLEEEKRLFYVGMTRAQEELIILTSGTPSPFIADIPKEHITAGRAFTPKEKPLYKQGSLF